MVVVSINHRLNVFGSTYLGDLAGSDFALSGAVGMLDIIAALQEEGVRIQQAGKWFLSTAHDTAVIAETLTAADRAMAKIAST